MQEFIEDEMYSGRPTFTREMQEWRFYEYLEETAPFIGNVVIVFNELEDFVSFLIMEMVSTNFARDEIPWIFIAEMPFGSKIKVLEKLYHFHLRSSSQDYQSPLQHLVDRLQACANKRNVYVHANWAHVTSSRHVRIRTKVRREGPRHVYRVMDPKLMQDDIDYIDETIDNIGKFEKDFMNH